VLKVILTKPFERLYLKMLTPSKAQKAFPDKSCPNFSSYSHIWLPRLSQNPTEWSQEEKVQKCSGGSTDTLWKQTNKKTHTEPGVGIHMSFRALLISNSSLTCSQLPLSLCTEVGKTAVFMLHIMSTIKKKCVLIPFVCLIFFYEENPKYKFKLKGD
jgi:hypothetical protein